MKLPFLLLFSLFIMTCKTPTKDNNTLVKELILSKDFTEYFYLCKQDEFVIYYDEKIIDLINDKFKYCNTTIVLKELDFIYDVNSPIRANKNGIIIYNIKEKQGEKIVYFINVSSNTNLVLSYKNSKIKTVSRGQF